MATDGVEANISFTLGAFAGTTIVRGIHGKSSKENRQNLFPFINSFSDDLRTAMRFESILEELSELPSSDATIQMKHHEKRVTLTLSSVTTRGIQNIHISVVRSHQMMSKAVVTEAASKSKVFGIPSKLTFDSMPAHDPYSDESDSSSENELFKKEAESESRITHVSNKTGTDMKEKSKISECRNNEDIASLKIIELSKRIRELMSSLATEQNKSRSLTKHIHLLESELKEKADGRTNSSPMKYNHRNTDQTDNSIQLKSLQEKLIKYEQSITELKNQNYIFKNELKAARKVLELETGESITNLSVWLKTIERKNDVDFNGIIKPSVQWRGRQQQIVLLKARLRSLEMQIQERVVHENRHSRNDNERSVEIGRLTSGATTLDVEDIICFGNELTHQDCNRSVTNRDQMSLCSKLKNVNQAIQLEKENETLREEIKVLKNRTTNWKTREQNLSLEFKNLKTQVQCLLNKSNNDEELIQSLLEYQKKLQASIQQELDKQCTMEIELRKKNDEACSVQSQHKNEIEKLQEIIELKEAKILELEKLLEEHNQTDSKIIKSGVDNNGQSRGTDGDDASLIKQVEMLVIERNGLRSLAETLNHRLEKLLMQIKELEQVNASYQRQREQEVRPTRGLMKTRKTRDSNEEKRSNSEQRLHELVSHEYSEKAIAGLNVSAANMVSKRIQELQSAISDLMSELTAVKSMSDRMRDARMEDFTILSQIVRQLRECCSDEKEE
ncbi:Coiled-coil domain-containing protein 13 [Paragonimus skrjabini miyazakii]|uniref:Coiled-coil domain-containing protein 13 n=1 Tax=Paragonimus skrjabini miyazakii TaxID=59628 RepID=A0A8S9Z980_9TREM|nr:Coiled-coil domain-containing protein 13 [Paragonimus skrjabini miyazakii]